MNRGDQMIGGVSHGLRRCGGDSGRLGAGCWVRVLLALDSVSLACVPLGRGHMRTGRAAAATAVPTPGHTQANRCGPSRSGSPGC
ncbi:hypothetical protein MTO96_038228 [Rhipicephalus appendiculatus]